MSSIHPIPDSRLNVAGGGRDTDGEDKGTSSYLLLRSDVLSPVTEELAQVYSSFLTSLGRGGSRELAKASAAMKVPTWHVVLLVAILIYITPYQFRDIILGVVVIGSALIGSAPSTGPETRAV